MTRVLAILWLSFAAVALIPKAAVAQEKPLIGLLAPLTGDDAAIGRRIVRAAQFAIGPRASVALEVFDSADDPVAALGQATAAGAVAVLGPLMPWRIDAVLAARAPSDIPIFLLSSVAGVEDASRGVYRLRTSPADQATGLAGVVLSDPQGPRRFALFAPDDSYGDEAVLAFVAAASEWGGVVDRVVRYAAGEVDVGDAAEELVGLRRTELVVPANPWREPPSARRVRRAGERTMPDAVFVPDDVEQVVSIVPFLAFHGWRTGASDEVGLLGLSGWSGPELSFVGDLVAGAFVVQVYDADDYRPAAEAFGLEFRVRFAETPEAFDAQVYDAAKFVAEAIASTASPDNPSELRRAASTATWSGACGTMRVNAAGGVERDLGLWQVDAGGSLYPLGVIERSAVAP